MPPAVGNAEASSDIGNATPTRIRMLINGHRIEIAIGPPLLNAWP
jgi:hypothetical protein